MAILQSATFNYAHISANTAATTLFTPQATNASSYAILHSVCVNTKGTASNVLTIWDNTAASGTSVAIVDTTLNQTTFMFDIACKNGLTIQLATGGAADLTIAWRVYSQE